MIPKPTTSMNISESTFVVASAPLLGRSIAKSTEHVSYRRFRAFFGVSPTVCVEAWLKLNGSLPEGARPVHLLWACMFLKVYATEEVHSSIAQVDAKTFRKWSWLLIRKLAELQMVRIHDPHFTP